MENDIDNTQKTDEKKKGKRGGRRSTTWKPGIPSPNPNGRPKDGQSFSEILRLVMDMNPEEILSFIDPESEVGQRLIELPFKVQMKYIAAINLWAKMGNSEITAGLLGEIVNRTDGKVPDKVQLDAKLNIDGLESSLDKIYGQRNDQG